MAHKAPGKAKRRGITVMELADMFPDNEAARQWFEKRIWPDGRHCPRCKGKRTREASHKTMPYWCTDCRKYFSVQIGTVMEASNLSYRDWVYAIYLHMTSLKGVSSMKLHRDIGIAQNSAWHLLQRIRKAFDGDDDIFGGPVEVDECYIGGLESNKHEHKKMNAGGGTAGKTAVVGAKDRRTGKVHAGVIKNVDALHLTAFVSKTVRSGGTVYTDENRSYAPTADRYYHETVNHSAKEFVNNMAHVNGIESFWATLKRAHKGVYHKISKKHLHRYVADFAGRHGLRKLDTLEQMGSVAKKMESKRLRYIDLIA